MGRSAADRARSPPSSPNPRAPRGESKAEVSFSRGDFTLEGCVCVCVFSFLTQTSSFGGSPRAKIHFGARVDKNSCFRFRHPKDFATVNSSAQQFSRVPGSRSGCGGTTFRLVPRETKRKAPHLETNPRRRRVPLQDGDALIEISQNVENLRLETIDRPARVP